MLLPCNKNLNQGMRASDPDGGTTKALNVDPVGMPEYACQRMAACTHAPVAPSLHESLSASAAHVVIHPVSQLTLGTVDGWSMWHFRTHFVTAPSIHRTLHVKVV